MKKLVIIGFMVLGYAAAFGQGAFDSNCYFPKIGNPDEIDTIVAASANQDLGGYLMNLGPAPNSTTGYGRVAFTGYRGNKNYHTSFSGGPTFDIHNLSPSKKMNFQLPSWPQFGYFRTTKHRDILAWGEYGLGGPIKIYWADDEGNYDSSRYGRLSTTLQGDSSRYKLSSWVWMRPYIADLNGDSIDDIVAGIQESALSPQDTDKIYLLYYNGKTTLNGQTGIVLSDSSLLFGNTWFVQIDSGVTHTKGNYRDVAITGDYRGTGRKDLICYDEDRNSYFYRNDGEFSMQKFKDAITRDTLFARWQNPDFPYVPEAIPDEYLTMKVYPKLSWDRSDDFIVKFEISDSDERQIFPFRGGPEFGSKRLLTDSCEFVLHHPARYDGSFSKVRLVRMTDCGDMTGTGNRVLCITGSAGSRTGLSLFYVLGKALDDKADMYFIGDDDLWSGSGIADTITADGDGLQDIIIGNSLYDQMGSIYLIKGTTKIPVTLNPKYGIQSNIKYKQNQLTSYPNPLDQKTTLTFENCTSGVMYMDVVNGLGVSVLREEIPDVEGLQQYAADLSGLPAGAYHIRLVCPADGWSASTSVIKTGAAVMPWSLNLKKMMGR